jgi:hypothetical protein
MLILVKILMGNLTLTIQDNGIYLNIILYIYIYISYFVQSVIEKSIVIYRKYIINPTFFFLIFIFPKEKYFNIIILFYYIKDPRILKLLRD